LSIPREPDIRDLRYLQLVSFRKAGQNEGNIARSLGFDSTRDLYRQLRYDGFPICPDCGATFVDERHCEAPKKHRERRAKTVGEAIPLPPAEGAIDLFKSTLQALDRELESLRGRREYLQSERFVGVDGEDGNKRAHGARQSPPEPLTTLIAVHALRSDRANSPLMWMLLDKLHPSEQIEVREQSRSGSLTTFQPDPKEVDMDRLGQAMRELRKKAADVAKLVRGGMIRKGPPTEEIPPRLHAVIDLVKQRAREGSSDEQIREEIDGRFDRGPLEREEDFTEEEVRWLKYFPFEGEPPQT
jgi:hypothetical protein